MLENKADWDLIFPALQHLKYNKHEIVIFHVNHPSTELDFTFENKPHIFTDLETGKQIKVNPDQVKETFQNKSKALFNELKLKAGQYKIDLVDANVEQPIDLILQSYMIKRSKI